MPPKSPRTLSIDVGGTGIKAMVLDAAGEPATERVRVKTPRPAKPAKILAAIVAIAKASPAFDRVSIGFPGVVVDGVVRTAPNLDGKWDGVELGRDVERALRRPVRVANDADMQGLGVVEGNGLELVITLGTGVGSALFLDGRLIPNFELGHHPFKGKRTYEDFVGSRAFERMSRKQWSKRVRCVLEMIFPIWNCRKVYLGGGNAQHVRGELPPSVEIVSNVEGILGGIRLWEEDVIRSPRSDESAAKRRRESARRESRPKARDTRPARRPRLRSPSREGRR
jgi:polyphosphate glucokinase